MTEAENDKAIVEINRAPVHALSDLQRNIQHFLDLSALAFRLSDNAEEMEFTFPGVYFGIQLAQNENKSFETVRLELRNWILRTGMRDCIESVNGFLVDIRQQCSIMQFIEKPNITWSSFNHVYERETEKFESLGLPKKIRGEANSLSERFGVKAPDDLVDAVLSMNAARNCLVHRGGRIKKVDADENGMLVVRWFGCHLEARSERGVRQLELPAKVESDESVEIIVKAGRSKSFALGEPILFSDQEFSEMCFTFYLFGLEITKSAEAFLAQNRTTVPTAYRSGVS